MKKSMHWRNTILSALLLALLPFYCLEALETDTFIVTDLTGHLSQQRQQALIRQAQDQLGQILRFYGEKSRKDQMGKILLEFDKPRGGIYATVFLMEGQAKRKARIVRIFGAEHEPQQVAHKLTHASFPGPDKLIRNMMGIPMEMRFGNPLSFPMCGFRAEEWVIAFRKQQTYLPLAQLGPNHEDWGMTTENGVPVTRNRAKQHIMYAESAAFGDYLLRTYSAETVKRFWQLSNNGKRPWEDVFGSSLSQLEMAWLQEVNDRYAKQETVNYLLDLFKRNPREACTEAQRKSQNSSNRGG